MDWNHQPETRLSERIAEVSLTISRKFDPWDSVRFLWTGLFILHGNAFSEPWTLTPPHGEQRIRHRPCRFNGMVWSLNLKYPQKKFGGWKLIDFLILVTFVHFGKYHTSNIWWMIHTDSLLKVWLANSPPANRKWHKFKNMSQWNDPKGWFCFRLSYVFVNNDDRYTECNLTWWMIDGWLVLSFDVLVLKDHVAIGYDELESLTKVFLCSGMHAGIFSFDRNSEVRDLSTWGLLLPYTFGKDTSWKDALNQDEGVANMRQTGVEHGSPTCFPKRYEINNKALPKKV